MRIDQVAEAVADHLFGRLLRRLLLALAAAVLALVALYYFTTAGTLALEAQYGALEARLIVGAGYAAAAIVCVIWWLLLGRASPSRTPVLSNPREMQITMLVEAAMLGYTLARKTPQSH
jgi:hypothetical protein